MVTPDSSATSRITAWAADSPTSTRPPGQLPIAVIDPTDQKDLAGPLRTGANAAGSTSCARGAFGSW
jgi:hypothetical protein